VRRSDIQSFDRVGPDRGAIGTSRLGVQGLAPGTRKQLTVSYRVLHPCSSTV
jgi:hypothetical protein